MQAVRGLTTLALVAAWILPSAASAQLTLERYVPAPVASDGFALSRPDAHGHLGVGAQLQLDFARDPLVYEAQRGGMGTAQSKVVHDHLVGHVLASLSVYDRGVFFVHAPVSLIMSGERSAALSADGAGLGNVSLGGRARLYGEPQDTFGLGLQASLGLPSAQWADARSRLQGEHKPSARVVLLADLRPPRWHLTANLGAGFRKAVLLDSFEVKQELIYGLGASYDLLEGATRLALHAEWFGTSSFADFGRREQTPMEVLGGLKVFRREGLMIGMAAGGGATRGLGSPAWRVVGALGYAMPVGASRDRDHDGLPDARDACPNEAEDVDGFQDRDGCRDADNDGDGLEDAVDQCPLEPEDRDHYEDRDGCAEVDNDGDAVVDTKDRCPTELEDRDDFEDDDGCLDVDDVREPSDHR